MLELSIYEFNQIPGPPTVSLCGVLHLQIIGEVHALGLYKTEQSLSLRRV